MYVCLNELKETSWQAVSLQIWTGYLTDTLLQCYHYSNLFSYTLHPLEKSWDKCGVLNNKNYNKFIHINIQFVHKHQLQLSTLSVTKTFLSCATQAVFHTLISAGGSNVHKMLFTDVRSFHQFKKNEKKLSELSVPSNHIWLTTCNRNNKNITQMY
jgi:hypothetical protein